MNKTAEELRAELAALDDGKAHKVETYRLPTPAFRKYVLWYTWAHGPNSSEGEFEDWSRTEGVRLTRLHDQRCLNELERLRKETPADEVSKGIRDILYRCSEGQLSWNYDVPKQFENSSGSFFVIRDDNSK